MLINIYIHTFRDSLGSYQKDKKYIIAYLYLSKKSVNILFIHARLMPMVSQEEIFQVT